MKPEITNVKIYPYRYKKGSMEVLAYAEITIENNLIIRGLRVMKTKENGIFISFPHLKNKNEFINIIDYHNSKYERYIRRTILNKYQEEIGDYHGT